VPQLTTGVGWVQLAAEHSLEAITETLLLLLLLLLCCTFHRLDQCTATVHHQLPTDRTDPVPVVATPWSVCVALRLSRWKADPLNGQLCDSDSALLPSGRD